MRSCRFGFLCSSIYCNASMEQAAVYTDTIATLDVNAKHALLQLVDNDHTSNDALYQLWKDRQHARHMLALAIALFKGSALCQAASMSRSTQEKLSYWNEHPG